MTKNPLFGRGQQETQSLCEKEVGLGKQTLDYKLVDMESLLTRLP
jgi:hypothetical protein